MRRAYKSRFSVGGRRGTRFVGGGRGNVVHYIPRNKSFIPGVYYNKMTMALPFQFSRVSSGMNVLNTLISIRANDLHSPIIISGSPDGDIQPQGYDNMNNFWDSWQVIATKFSLKLMQNFDGGAATSQEVNPFTVFMRWATNNAETQSIQSQMASRFAKHTTVMPYVNQVKPSYMSMYAKTAAILTHNIDQDVSTYGFGNKTGSASPDTLTYLIINGYQNNITDVDVNLYMEMTITFWVKWFNPIVQTSSSVTSKRGIISITTT